MNPVVKTVAAALCLLAATAIVNPDGKAHADQSPRVVASIRPLHSLVAAVMGRTGAPALIVTSPASPHTYTLKPSGARLLSRAEIVFWIGPQLEGFLVRPLAALAGKARVVALGEADGLARLANRATIASPPDSDDGHDEHDDHAHDHTAGATNMHLWLDPRNAAVMADDIAATLAAVDPRHAARYRANAAALKDRLQKLEDEISQRLAPVRARPFVIWHDAYRYFEARFGLAAAAVVTTSPERAPGARSLSEARRAIARHGVKCVFHEPQVRSRLPAILVENTPARIATLDPLASTVEPGPELYFALVRNLAEAMRKCLAGE